MTEEKKRGRGRPAGAPNKPKLKLITKLEAPQSLDKERLRRSWAK